MKIHILSLFPEFFQSFLEWSIIGRAVEDEKVIIDNINIRDFSKNKHKKVDDYPFGGGTGMLMTAQPVHDAIESSRGENSRVIYLSPQGRTLDQELALELSREEDLVLVCGHYEGLDNRIVENYIDDEISIGDFVLTGGELAAMVLMDSIIRLLPGVLRSEDSYKDESHYHGLLEAPQYTRPRVFKGHSVPDVLISGDHRKIHEWKRKKSLETTLLKRPDMIKEADLDREDKKILSEIKRKLNKEI